jgi:hypothetical protein
MPASADKRLRFARTFGGAGSSRSGNRVGTFCQSADAAICMIAKVAGQASSAGFAPASPCVPFCLSALLSSSRWPGSCLSST